MTDYSVIFTEQAARELEAAADWWAEHRSARRAARWYAGFSSKIAALRTDPEACPLANENDEFSRVAVKRAICV